jgi:hypothetical protein
LSKWLSADVNVALIRAAAERLHIKEVYVRKVQMEFGPAFNPASPPPEMTLQTRRGKAPYSRFQLKDEGQHGSEQSWIEFREGFAVRLVSPEVGPTEEIEPEHVFAEISSVLGLQCLVRSDIPEEALEEFAKHNVAHIIWPYWRELIASTLARGGLVGVTLPLLVSSLTDTSDEAEAGDQIDSGSAPAAKKRASKRAKQGG